MQQTGEYRINAPRDAVWQALNDPDVLARCIEGCRSLDQVDDDRYEGVVDMRVGPLRATFQAEFEVTASDPPESYRLEVNVKGGAAGFGKGHADVRLDEVDGGTRLTYAAEGSVGGKLAQVGNRLLDGTLRKLGDDFFDRFGEIVAPGGVEKAAVAPEPQAARYEPSGQWRIWLVVAIVLAASAFLALAL